MKKVIIFICLSQFLFAQKHDNTWIVGFSSLYGPYPNLGVGLTLLEFQKDGSLKMSFPKKSNMEISNTTATICDKTGKLAFYTNGQLIENFNQDTLKGSAFFKSQSYGFTVDQGCLVLPYPEKDSLYMMLSQRPSFLPTGDFGISEFALANIDMSKNGGKGEVIDYGFDFFDYYVAYGKLTAVKHGNGRDWWILVLGLKTNKIRRYIFTKNGLKYVGIQEYGPADPQSVGYAAFSPDGTKHVRYHDISSSLPQHLDVYDFDRCSGLLSNHKRISYKDMYGGGVAFSPSSRFLYVGLGDEVRQYDLQKATLLDAESIVATIDTHTSCKKVEESFFNAQLAPNGKIYFSTQGCSKVLHVINEPDKLGKACNVENHGVILPTSNYHGLPNFPNYKLGKMAGCTTSLNDETEKEEINIYPNPAQNQISFKLENQEYNKGDFFLSDLQGRHVATYPLLPNHDEYRFDISQLQNGIYIWQLVLDDKVRKSGKVVVLKE